MFNMNDVLATVATDTERRESTVTRGVVVINTWWVEGHADVQSTKRDAHTSTVADVVYMYIVHADRSL